MAGLPNGERFVQQPTSRPSIQSQHSNSVPSTPYQKPRDFSRRYSKSPSPHRNLSNQSPQSVVSEAVGGANGTRRSTPLVCKFETGDEIRKRRMPYVDGGDQELRPPQKEPRTILNPDEQDRLSGDMRELYDRLLPSQESEERRAQLVTKLERILHEEWPGNDICVNVFGSSGNLLSSTDSDVDICITTSTMKELERMHALAALLDKHGMDRVVCRAAAKVPIVKCWDPVLQLASDLNVNNPLALENTRLVKTYVQLDDRVRPLAKIVKHWTKQRILNDAAFGATISSYTWICMVISFLQRRKPPVLPSLQKTKDCRIPSEDGKASTFADDVAALKGFGDANKESLGELLFHFFRHYGYEFEYSKYVISVREGRLVSRKEKGWDPGNALADKQAHNRLCVEEPFTSQRNLGNTADDYAWHGIHLEIRRAFELLNDGLQLEKCCEQYQFPVEEKPIFQRPPPKPKPTLTRSASQSGQTNREGGPGGRSRKNNRNQSSQRTGNRRASSGASFSHQRVPFSPSLGANSADYFQLKGNLHEQLYQQYQFLQAQQDALRSQLAQQQAQAQSRVGDLAGSPRPRAYMNGLSTSGLSSPQLGDLPPQTASLLPGYLYHYPARYPQSSPMSQARSREGTTTNPSSPSLVASLPALRRQANRTSVQGEGSTGSTRSQSQPGRSLPHPLTLQQQVHPGYDVSGPLTGVQYPSMRSVSQLYHPEAGVMPLSFSAMHPSTHSLDSTMPKEYVGYYVSQSPQLGPQQFGAHPHIAVPAMNLRDPFSRQRRETPELQPPVLNGRHSSRSPSPLDRTRSFPTAADRQAGQPGIMQSPTGYDQAATAILPVPSLPPQLAADIDTGGPLIVNGSNRNGASRVAERVNGAFGDSFLERPDVNALGLQSYSEDSTRVRPLPIRTEFGSTDNGHTEVGDRPPTPPRISAATTKATPDRRAVPMSPAGTSVNGVKDHFYESTPLTAPLLSPVAELRTPSPTHPRFDVHDSPEANGGLVKAVKIANAKQVMREFGENQPPRADSRHERRGSAPTQMSNKPTQTVKTPVSQTPTQLVSNTWQQVSKKGHKKNKSAVAGKAPNGSGGQPMPANEAERKGG